MASTIRARTPAQLFALGIGVVYLLIGIVGFAVTGFDNFACDNCDEKLLIFGLNPLHNLVHIALGGVWIGVSKTHEMSKRTNLVLGAVLLLVFLLGMFGALEWLSIEDAAAADNYLHLATGALAVYFGTAGAEGTSATVA